MRKPSFVGGFRLVRLARLIVAGAVILCLCAAAHFALAQSDNDSSDSQLHSQGGAPPAPPPGIAGQGSEDDRTLEIAPQPGATMPKAGVAEIPDNRTFRPGDDTTSVNRNYRPDSENDLDNPDNRFDNRPHKRPYLGITVRYASKCYKGGEEHGLEVLTVDPNSPAAQAGIHTPTGATVAGVTGATLGALVPFVGAVTNRLLEQHGALGMGGDLIVAVDDNRVRSQADLDDAMARLKPGDTLYLTVIRPQMGGGHGPPLKIAIHVGAVGEPIANAGGGGGGVIPAPSSSEDYAR